MRNCIISEHTADVRLRIEGSDQQELFIAALDGMNRVIKKGFKGTYTAEALSFELRIESRDMTTLLIDFLSEVLTLSHIYKGVFTEAVFRHLDDKKLDATVSGECVDSFDEDIKAVSYHEAEVECDAEGIYRTNIILDI